VIDAAHKLPRPFQHHCLVVVVLFCLLSVAATWPLAVHLRTAVPLGSETVATVPLFNSWAIWWNADRVRVGFRDYWDAPIFHPTRGMFALSEPLPLTAAASPLTWFAGSPALTMNVLVLAALMVNGWSGYRLLLEIGLGVPAALCGGAMTLLLPFVHQELGVFQLVWVCGGVWVVHALVRLCQAPATGTAVALGLSYAFTYLACTYYGVFLLPVLAASVIWLLWGRWKRIAVWGALAGSMVVTVLLTWPVVVGQARAVRQHELRRSPQKLRELSATLDSYTHTAWRSPIGVPCGGVGGASAFPMCPGSVKVGLAAVGIVAGFWSPRTRRWTGFCVTFGVVALLLSLGPRLQVCGWSPYTWLAALPGFGQARSVFRFGVFVQIAVAWLAAGALDGLWRIVREKRGRLAYNLRAVFFGLLILTGTVATIELWPPPQRVFVVPHAAAQQWVQWLRDDTSPDAVIVHLPIPTGATAADYEPTALAMYLQTVHGRRMVNGYSGFFPGSSDRMCEQLRHFPDAASVGAVSASDIDYCIVDHRLISREAMAAACRESRAILLPVLDDTANNVGVYRVMR